MKKTYRILIPSFLIVSAATSAFASSDQCPSLTVKLMPAQFTSCKTPESYALPRYKYFSQNSEALPYVKRLTVEKGYLTSPGGSPILIKEPRVLDGDLFLPAVSANGATRTHEELRYASFLLRNVTVESAWIQRGVVTPNNFVPYLIPEAKIPYLRTDGLQCEFISGQIKVEETCEEIRVDQGQHDCECAYKVLE